jgi:hypothetical protein
MLLVAAILGATMGKSFSVWSKPDDRLWLTEEILSQFNLI